MDTTEREKLIAQYRDGYRAVAEALLRITPEELDARPGEGRWTAREVVHHLADSEMAAAVRIRMILAEDRPAFSRSDQDEYARRLHYDRPHESSLELFRYTRDATAELLERMTPADWLREGVHATSGSFGLPSGFGREQAQAGAGALGIERPGDARGARRGAAKAGNRFVAGAPHETQRDRRQPPPLPLHRRRRRHNRRGWSDVCGVCRLYGAANATIVVRDRFDW